MSSFDYHSYIWPGLILTVKVKIAHIWTRIFSTMVTDRVNIANAIKNVIAYGLSINEFKFDTFALTVQTVNLVVGNHTYAGRKGP